ncbi:MAG: carboxypeptidase-like regulatory domain-containing protein, partial [Bryobacteraceae bacterium]
MTYRMFIRSLLLMVLLPLWCNFSEAQVTTGTIVGTVTDASGGVVSHAKVTVTNIGTDASRSMDSDEAGNYAFNLLRAGQYRVHIEAPGFQSFEVDQATVGVGDTLRIDAHIQVGESSETVEVTSEAPLLQTDSSAVQSTVTERAVQDLPLNGRNLTGLVQVQPGVNAGPPNAISSGNRPDDRRPTSAYSANGQSDLFNNNQVDGLDNNEREQGFTGIRPSIDGVSEVRV